MTVPVHLIEAKRDGASLDPTELRAFLEGYLVGEIADYQMSAFLMATLFRGMDPGELDVLVATMIESGATLDFGDLDRPRVDKHSTGGVGDKVSLVLAPLVAELGVYVPMMSGRGLGHTGGTLDKLEAIPGFCTDLSLERFRAVLLDVGCAMIGQTTEIAPLDRRLYDLRSVTGTVPSIPLIAASIMSKKLSEGLTALVLDVKVGSGAFLPGEQQALELAHTMVAIGEARGVRTEAVLTAMDRPLGYAVGNGLETKEAFACLAGSGPPDLRRLVVHFAARMVALGGDSRDPALIEADAERCLDDGRALRRMERLVEAQGGDPRVVAEPGRLETAPVVREVRAEASGTVTALDPRPLGSAVVEMGGGRTRLDQEIDLRSGFRLAVSVGVHLEKGQVIAEVHAPDEDAADVGERAVRSAARVDGVGVPLRPLVSHRVTKTATTRLAIG